MVGGVFVAPEERRRRRRLPSCFMVSRTVCRLSKECQRRGNKVLMEKDRLTLALRGSGDKKVFSCKRKQSLLLVAELLSIVLCVLLFFADLSARSNFAPISRDGRRSGISRMSH